MAWLVNALLEVIKDLVYGAFVLITKWFTGTLTLSTGEFHDIFNKGEEMNLLDLLVDDVIGPLAVAGVIGIMAYQLYRSMFAKKVQGAVDEPLPLILWSVVAFFLVFNVKPVLSLFSDLIAKAWGWMDGVTHEFSTNFSLDALLSDQKFGDDGVTSSLNFSSGIGLSGLQMLIGIVLAAVLGWRYLKLMVQYVKRYVRYQLLRVLAPVGICTIGSNSTRQMAQNYLKLYISSTLSMLFSGMMTYIYCWAMMQTLLWESDLIADNILLFCITLGIYDFFQYLDQLLEKIGLLSTGMQPIRLPIGIGGISAGLSSKGQQMVVNSAKTAFQTLKMAKGTPTGGETKGTSALGGETLAEGKTATPAAELLNESEISNDVKANTQAFSESLGGKQYQTQQGEVPTKENSSMAVMRTAPDGSISARNITKEANGDGWRELSTGNRLSGADAVHGLTGVQGINPYDLQQTGDALEQHAAGKPGKERAYGAFQREDTQFAAKFQKNDAGGWNTLVGGTSYETPQQAAAALGADSMAVYDGRSDMKGFDMAKIAASDVNLADQAAFEAGLSEHAVSGPAGENAKAYGALHGADGAIHPAEFSKTESGWEATVGGQAYASIQDAATAVGADRADIYAGAPKPLPAAQLKGGGANQALADEAGLRSFGVAAMPKNQGFQVHTVGNGEMHGIYADQKGAVHSFSGTRVTQTYAQQNPESCVRLDDTTYLKIHEGSSNRAVNAYANATTFKNGTFQNKYDTKTHLNNDGSVGDGT